MAALARVGYERSANRWRRAAAVQRAVEEAQEELDEAVALLVGAV